MIKKKLTDVRDSIEDRLRSLLGKITPDKRIIIILVMLFVFSAASVYMTVSSIYNMGKKSVQEQMKIEHVKQLKLKYQQKADSINHKNKFNDE